MVSDCGCVNYENSRATYNQWNSWLNRNNSSTNYTNPTYSYDPAMSFNGSVFDFDNSTFANTYGGTGLNCLGSYMGGYGMPYGGNMWNNADSWWDYMDKYSDRSMSYNRHRIERQREDEMYINGPSDRIKGKMDLLKRAINKNDQENMVEIFNNYCQAVKEMYPNYEGKALVNRALAMYAQANGVSFIDDLTAHSRGMLGQKFLNSLTFGIAAKGSAEENIAEITNSPMSPKDRRYGKLGQGAGAATLAAAGTTTGLLIFKNAEPIKNFMSKGKWGWAIAGIATAVGLITALASGNKKSKSPAAAVKIEKSE